MVHKKMSLVIATFLLNGCAVVNICPDPKVVVEEDISTITESASPSEGVPVPAAIKK